MIFDNEVGVLGLEDEEDVCDGDGSFEETAAGFDRGWWVIVYESGQ